MLMENKLKYMPIVVSILIAITIFVVSSISFSEETTIYAINLKSIGYHFSIFFFLSAFLMLALSNTEKFSNYSIIILTLITCLLYAFLDELHQFFVPGRYLSFADIAIDSLGIIAGMIFVWSFIYLKKR